MNFKPELTYHTQEAQMGLINWLIHRNMRKQTIALAEWAADTYKKVQAENSELTDREVYRKLLDQRIRFPGGESDREKVLDRYGSSLHGLCYYLGLNSSLMQGMMVSRCLQFTEHLDAELHKHGIERPPAEIKRKYFKALGLPEDAVDKTI